MPWCSVETAHASEYKLTSFPKYVRWTGRWDKFAVERHEHEELRWGTLTMQDKFADWEHKLSFIVGTVGSWAVAKTSAGDESYIPVCKSLKV